MNPNTNQPKEKYLVTSALPYANGPLHFGHLAGVYLPADIYCRHQKALGKSVLHICGSDEHGVAIMLAAEKAGMAYQAYVDMWHTRHVDLMAQYGIEFDFYGRTTAPYHEREVLRWFHELNHNGYIEKRSDKQLYCNHCPRFLPDRYVEGECYVCGYANARGDECPNCGEWIDALRLIHPTCKICNSNNIDVKDSEQWYLLLTKLAEKFQPWFEQKRHWRPHVWGYVNSLLSQGLVDRAITRDLEWGIPVPLPDAAGKRLYVWFDAPIGYVSNTQEFLSRNGSKEDAIKDWWANPTTRVIHFIGKDNIIFHGLIWPCMILGTGFVNLPVEVPASNFVNLEGKQFSKSSGWYVDSTKTVEVFGQDAVRFYLCTLIPESHDSNFSWDGFLRVNTQLSNNIGNFINRVATFVEKHWSDGLLGGTFAQALTEGTLRELAGFVAAIRDPLDSIEHQRAITGLLKLGEAANEAFHAREPWKVIKSDKDAAAIVIANSLAYILVICSVVRPFLPGFAASLYRYFQPNISDEILDRVYRGDMSALTEYFSNGYQLPLKPGPLLPRIDPKSVDEFRLTEKPTSQ